MLNLTYRKIILIVESAIILAIVLVSNEVFAIDSKIQMKGDGFSKACTIPDESWVSFCNGYIQAVIDSVEKNDRVCPPDGTTRTELVTITEKEITASSQLRSMNAHDAVLTVLRRFYPCR